MRNRIGIFCLTVTLIALSAPASAESCSDRNAICKGACTPGWAQQAYGGSIPKCVASCQTRFQSCMRTGIWVHMGAATKGMRQKVDRR